MPRRPRGVIVDSLVHVISRGNRGLPIYLGDQDCQAFLEYLQEYVPQYTAQVHGYCLMTNHFHLVVEVGPTPLSKLMHALLNRFTKYFNRRHGYDGHLFGDRFWSKPCDSEAQALATVGYIHLNPCRAGITPSPEGYRWSTHGAYLGTSALEWISTSLLDLFSVDRGRAHAQYAQFIDFLAEPFRGRVFE